MRRIKDIWTILTTKRYAIITGTHEEIMWCIGVIAEAQEKIDNGRN